MIGFGEDNEEFGRLPPSLISCEEVRDDEGFAENSLLIRIMEIFWSMKSIHCRDLLILACMQKCGRLQGNL